MSGDQANIEEIHRLYRFQIRVLSVGGYVERNQWWLWSVATVVFVSTVGLWSIIPYWSFILLTTLAPRYCRRLAERIGRRISHLQRGYEVKA